MRLKFSKYAICLIILLLSSCNVVKFPQIVKLSNIRINRLTDTSAHGLFNATIYNPNFFSFTLKHLDYKAYSQGYFFGQGQIDTVVKFPEKQAVELKDLEFNVQTRDLNRIFASLKQLDSLPLRFYLKARLKGVFFPIYWIKTVNLDLRQSLSALVNWHNVFALSGIPRISINKIGFKQTQLTVTLNLKNQFNVEYYFDTVKLAFYDRYNNYIGSSQLTGVHVRPFSITKLPFQLIVDNLLLAVSLMGQYIEQNFEFRIKGYLIFRIDSKSLKIPINEKIMAKIERQTNNQ